MITMVVIVVMVVIGSYQNARGRGCCERPPRARADRVTAASDRRGKRNGGLPSGDVKEKLQVKATAISV